MLMLAISGAKPKKRTLEQWSNSRYSLSKPIANRVVDGDSVHGSSYSLRIIC